MGGQKIVRTVTHVINEFDNGRKERVEKIYRKDFDSQKEVFEHVLKLLEEGKIVRFFNTGEIYDYGKDMMAAGTPTGKLYADYDIVEVLEEGNKE